MILWLGLISFSVVTNVQGVTTNIDHCIVEKLFVPAGTTWQPAGKCQEATCQGKNLTTYSECPAPGTVQEGWVLTPEDPSKPYPECCAKVIQPGVNQTELPQKPEKPLIPDKPEVPQQPDQPEAPQIPDKPDMPLVPGIPIKPGRPQRPGFFYPFGCHHCGCNFIAWCLGNRPQALERPSLFPGCHFSPSWCFGNRPAKMDFLSDESSEESDESWGWGRRNHRRHSGYYDSSEEY